MIILYILTSLFASAIWIDYYRRIDVFEQEKLKHVIPVFFAGAAFTFLVSPVTGLIHWTGFTMTGDYLNDFLYCVTAIGFLEELVKGSPVLLFMIFYRKNLNEPIDYLLYAAMSALGFAFVENVMYTLNHDSFTLLLRTVISSVSHVIDSSIWIYGFMLVRFREQHRKNAFLTIAFYILLASLSHGFFDYWLMMDIPYGFLVTLLYFMLTVSVYCIILNNCLNNSEFFSYKKAVNSANIQNNLLKNYGILILLIVLCNTIETNFLTALRMLTVFLFSFAYILMIIILRSSRFKLIQGRWNPVRLELPFTYDTLAWDSMGSPGQARIGVRGSVYNEELIAPFYQEYCIMGPWNPDTSFLGEIKAAYLMEKLFLEDDEVLYRVKVFMSSTESRDLCLRARRKGTTSTTEDYPVCALLEYKTPEIEMSADTGPEDFLFWEWIYLRPMKEEERAEYKYLPVGP